MLRVDYIRMSFPFESIKTVGKTDKEILNNTMIKIIELIEEALTIITEEMWLLGNIVVHYCC